MLRLCQKLAGDAALLVDPNCPEEIAEAMDQLVSNEQLRNKLIEKGAIRCKNFFMGSFGRAFMAKYFKIHSSNWIISWLCFDYRFGGPRTCFGMENCSKFNDREFIYCTCNPAPVFAVSMSLF
jgi:hypothetical protein